MAKKNKRWVPGVPEAEYELQDGGLLSLPGDQRKLCQCSFCAQIMRRHLMLEHLRERILSDLNGDMCMCRALQISHYIRDLGGIVEEYLATKCRQERRSRTAIIFEYGDPRDWK